jgi:hypothetical protein
MGGHLAVLQKKARICPIIVNVPIDSSVPRPHLIRKRVEGADPPLRAISSTIVPVLPNRHRKLLCLPQILPGAVVELLITGF